MQLETDLPRGKRSYGWLGLASLWFWGGGAALTAIASPVVPIEVQRDLASVQLRQTICEALNFQNVGSDIDYHPPLSGCMPAQPEVVSVARSQTLLSIPSRVELIVFYHGHRCEVTLLRRVELLADLQGNLQVAPGLPVPHWQAKPGRCFVGAE